MSTLQHIHYWISVLAGGALLGACVALLVGICHPIRSKRGDMLVKGGAVVALITVAAYLVYAATIVTAIVVMRA